MSVRQPTAGAAPFSDKSSDEGSKDDARQYIPAGLAGDVPEYTLERDLGHSEAGTNDAAAPVDEGSVSEDEETVRGRVEEFAQEQAPGEVSDSARPVIPPTIRVEVEVEDLAANLDTRGRQPRERKASFSSGKPASKIPRVVKYIDSFSGSKDAGTDAGTSGTR
ncbi:hypothetical protein QYF36_012306 [Acer negundo]|nr:hypothetical protein QYF36_012306 [Acer negundo]